MRKNLLTLILSSSLFASPSEAKIREYDLRDLIPKVEEFSPMREERNTKENTPQENKKLVSIKDDDGNFMPDCDNSSVGCYPDDPNFNLESYIDNQGVWHIRNGGNNVAYVNLIYDVCEEIPQREFKCELTSQVDSSPGKIQFGFKLNNSKNFLLNLDSNAKSNSYEIHETTMEFKFPLKLESRKRYPCEFYIDEICKYFTDNPPDRIESLEVTIFVMPNSSYEIKYELE